MGSLRTVHRFHPYELHTQAFCPDTAAKELPDPAASHEPEAQTGNDFECGICVATGHGGNLFYESLICGFFNGAMKPKVEDLLTMLKEHYAFFKTATRISTVTEEMIKAKDKAPKLRTKAAECRCIVPFAFQLASDMGEKMTKLRFKTMAQMFGHHLDFYMAGPVLGAPRRSREQVVELQAHVPHVPGACRVSEPLDRKSKGFLVIQRRVLYGIRGQAVVSRRVPPYRKDDA